MLGFHIKRATSCYRGPSDAAVADETREQDELGTLQ